MSNRKLLLAPALALLVVFVAGAFLVSARLTPHAIQTPRISIDMDRAGNTYSSSENSMTVGTINDASTSCPGDNSTHMHKVDVVITDVEDLIGWQVIPQPKITKRTSPNDDDDAVANNTKIRPLPKVMAQ